MREHKLRAFNVTTQTYCFHGKGLTLRQISKLGESYFQEDILWEEYIDKKDKHGKEIYEGDRVQHFDYPWLKAGGVSTVRWNDDACGFDPFSHEIEEYGRPNAGEWIEIIGNIHQPIKGVKQQSCGPTT